MAGVDVPRILCVCGERHPVVCEMVGVPVIECPSAPADSWTMVDGRYAYQDGARSFPEHDSKVWVIPRGR